ncbi:MAG: DUF2269 family protein [Deltaproteobacteria bacterium]|jgi:hypothetical protein|nr:DUF2269 family protein [Deltaproteobacteria bacterium]
MAILGPKGMRILKFFHLITAGLWIGAAVALNLMVYALPLPDTDGELYAYNVACKFIDDRVLIPGAVGCLISGFLICLLTQWGFFKHRWVIIKWILTVACILFGTFYLSNTINGQPGISAEEGIMALANADYVANRLGSLRGGLVQLFCLVFMFYLSVFKPLKGRGKRLIPKVPDLEA